MIPKIGIVGVKSGGVKPAALLLFYAKQSNPPPFQHHSRHQGNHSFSLTLIRPLLKTADEFWFNEHSHICPHLGELTLGK